MPQELTDRKLSWVEDRLIEANLKYNVQSIFIDHLHFLVEMIAKQNISFVVGQVVRGLKEIAKRQNMVAFLICHTGKTREDTGELGLGMVRDSSFIEQEADSVIYVWRGDEEEREIGGEKRRLSPTWAKIAKNRKRGIINKKVPLYYFRGIYYESAEYEEQYYGRYRRA
jgi:replicative DNA helicase